jgi:probable DNA metabolism protein
VTLFLHDNTFDGLLTALFEAYERGFPDGLLREGDLPPLFHDAVVRVITDEQKARRVWDALGKKLSAPALSALAAAWLSGAPKVDLLLFRYIRKAIDAPASIELNFADPDVLELSRLAKRVARERVQVLQFLRFRKSADGIFFATVEPLYDVLPATIDHFKERFADQPWLIYDLKRGYGFYHDTRRVVEVRFTGQHACLLADGLLDSEEKQFQELWKAYFHAATIRERLNPALHRQNLPTRFWKYLTEKQ